MTGTEFKNSPDRTRTIAQVRAAPPSSLEIAWSDRTTAIVDLEAVLVGPFAALREPAAFARVSTGEWGHSVRWLTGEEIGADTLWLETLTAVGKDDARRFLEWRLRNGLSLSRAAAALGLSRRMVVYYSNGDKTVPRHVLLACRGWEAEQADGPTDAPFSVHEAPTPGFRRAARTTSRGEQLVRSLPLKQAFRDAHDRRAYLRMVEVARRIVDEPGLIANGRDFLERFARNDARQRGAYRMWTRLLRSPVETIARQLLADDETGASLRETAPVFTVVGAAEARRLWRPEP